VLPFLIEKLDIAMKLLWSYWIIAKFFFFEISALFFSDFLLKINLGTPETWC
jgi:hypothetical protein